MGKNSALVANTDQTLDLVLLIVPAKHLQLGQTHRDELCTCLPAPSPSQGGRRA